MTFPGSDIAHLEYFLMRLSVGYIFAMRYVIFNPLRLAPIYLFFSRAYIFLVPRSLFIF
ncbi:hypothetical protein F5X99DRAFT_377942 [Biscogniauxia marginata]|nr:hypothetical protein F5X99DRAFT_377942 [Biscogniauxia marginata]